MRLLAVALCIVLLPGPTWAAVGCTIYVDSVGGSDTSPYDTQAKAAATVSNALGVWGTSDTICVEDNHSESTSSTLTWTATGDTASLPVPIYSVAFPGDTYSAGSAAQVTVTGVNDMLLNANFRIYGLRFSVGDDFDYSQGDTEIVLTEVYVELTSAGGRISGIGADRADVVFNGGTIDFSNASGGRLGAQASTLVLNGVTFAGNAASAGLVIGSNASNIGRVVCVACDLSAFSGDILMDASSVTGAPLTLELYGALLPASITMDDGGFSNGSQYVFLSGTDDATGDESFRQELHGFHGTITTDTTVYHDNGLVFTEGTTNASIKFEPASNVSEWEPLCSWPTTEWINTTGSKTWTTELVENFTSALTDAEVWQEIFYLGTSSSPEWSLDLGQTVGGTTNLAAGTGLGNWTAEPSGSRSVKLTTTATVNKAGVYQIRWCVGAYEAGKVVHIDPDPSIS